jgi:cytidylate kinase
LAEINIAIDGPAASGKGSVARGVAQALGFQYVDTGAMYRAVALLAERSGVSWDDESALEALLSRLSFKFVWDHGVLNMCVNGEDVSSAIRTGEIGAGASLVSRFACVRGALLRRQQLLAEGGGVVMDGRDIGTTVLPRANLKVFLEAALAIRASRRHEELAKIGEMASLASVREDLALRDEQDIRRPLSPLRMADDAVLIDSSNLSIEAVVAQVVVLAERARARQID